MARVDEETFDILNKRDRDLNIFHGSIGLLT